MTTSTVHLNGTPATAESLTRFAFAGFAHFTAMQIRENRVRGLDLHLRRLREASDQLFGAHSPDHIIVSQLRGALSNHFERAAEGRIGAPNDNSSPTRAASLMCFITPRTGEFTPAAGKVDAANLDIIIKVGPAHDVESTPLSFDLVEHERHLPTIKHVGEIAKVQFLWSAQARGFDDAAFVNRRGLLSEATIWNLAFFDGSRIVWPEATVLPGVTMQILQRQLNAHGIEQITRPVSEADLRREDFAAVAANSWTPGVPIQRLGEVELSGDSTTLMRIMHNAYASEGAVTV